MKRDRLKDLESRYWEGKSSLEDEQNLKATKDNPYFEGLGEAKKGQMDWDFDDFMHQAEGRHTAPKRVIKPIWKYMSIVAALLIIGFMFLTNRVQRVSQEEDASFIAQMTSVEDTSDFAIESNIVAVAPHQAEVDTMPNSAIREVPEDRLDIQVEPDVVPAEEAYVLVNGVPVYDQEEAEQILIASLQLMANNLQEGRDAVEKMKYMKVKL